MIGKIQNKKKKHESSWKLAKLLIKKDRSWEKTHTKPDIGIISFGETEGSESEKEGVVGKKEEKKGNNDNVNPLPFPTTPLLIATSTGIEEIVNGILKEHPQAVEHVSDEGLNIMHVAIRHRQRNIFKRVKKMKILMVRLVRKIDDNGYTLLHHVSDMTHYYSSGSLPNAALQLQDELKWFERVRKIIPSHYEMNHRKVNGQTAEDMFEKSHAELHKEAQSWLKRTSESSSVIAVLIATVAFTAAYTVPGGSDQLTGHPILLHDPFFVVFTVMDVLSLVSSLTSVVMFISILTSPFRLQDFRESLPRKLTLAFTFLFLSVASTMLAFSATVILIVHMKKRWITTLVVYGVAFVPVTVFGLLQFPLYVAFMGTVKYSLTILKKALPWNFLRLLLFCNNRKYLFINKGN
nr:ankyrin repeat-containing protein ITN1-like [Ziziphus jujuba var. spinosa]